MFPILSALQNEKYDHESRAKDRLVKELKNPIIKKVFELGGFGKEHRMVVFGRSGVGKTTLILKLLGAKAPLEHPEFNLVNLAESIRGNTVEGGAGTVTVYRYKISMNEKGSITLPENKIVDFSELNELKDHLQDIRNKVESGNWNYNIPVIITLPNQYFNLLDNTPWIITDIPGIHSNIKKEHNHVSDLVKAYVLQCNVLLIVEKSSQIAQLKTLKIPGLGSWNYLGRRCRLIISHSMSEDSVKFVFRNRGVLKTDELIDYYKKLIKGEIQVDGIDVYPLDYGHSWETIQLSEKALFDNVNEAMQGVHTFLQNSLTMSMKPVEEYKSLMDIKHLEDKFKKDIKEYNNQIEELIKQNKAYKSDVKAYEERIEGINSDSTQLTNNKSTWESKKNNMFINPWIRSANDVETYDDNNEPKGHNVFWEKNKNIFRVWIEQHSENKFNDCNKIDHILQSNYSDYPPFSLSWRDYSDGWKDWDESYEHTFFSKVKKFCTLGLAPCKNDKRTLARNAHRKAVRDGLEQIFTIWTQRINQVVIDSIDHEIAYLDKIIKSKDMEIKIVKDDIDKKHSLIKENCSKIKITRKDLSFLRNSKKEDLSAFSESYPKFRSEELCNSSKKIMTLAKKAKSPAASLQYLAFVRQIVQLSKTISN